MLSKIKNAIKSALGNDEEDLPARAQRYNVVFAHSQLGITISKDSNDKPIVTSVVANSSAAQGGVQIGDIIIGVEGNQIDSYDTFMSVYQALGRPITISFAASSSQFRAPSFSSPKEEILTEQEKQQRREAALRAAEERNKAWDKRSRPKRESKDPSRATPEYSSSSDPETIRAAERARQAEQRLVQEMGYNPFQPHISTNQQGRTAVTEVRAGPLQSQPLPQLGAPLSHNNFPGEPQQLSGRDSITIPENAQSAVSEEVVTSTRNALALLMTNDGATRAACVQTLLKVLGNVIADPANEKFRAIRLANKVIHAKIADVHGGLELMTAAGFALEIEGEEAIMKHPGSADSEASANLQYVHSQLRANS